jgi:hypothetical protein
VLSQKTKRSGDILPWLYIGAKGDVTRDNGRRGHSGIIFQTVAKVSSVENFKYFA